MRFFADLHIHSHFSIATSKQLVPEHLDYWAALKGLTVIGTGDFTHPGWLAELKEKLEPAEPGLFRLKSAYRLEGHPGRAVRFVLSAEISSIYKKDGRVRKVHNVILAPDFETVGKIQHKLGQLGNITSDGRPILGLDSRDLLEIALEANENIFFIPAHIWTPWFSALGSKSGFDSITDCYDDLAGHIFAVETGLSTDPAMNWMCRFLDSYTLLSNSDAHSPEKLGRNANIFDCELSYAAMMEAMKDQQTQAFAGTVDLFPQEGKYHYDGHRKCGVRWNPLETMQHNGLCSVCGKPVTLGVLHRVAQLADRAQIETRPHRKPFHSIIPLKEILSEVLHVGAGSAKVDRAYHQLLQKAGSEFDILLNTSLDDLKPALNELLLEALRRMRAGEIHIEEGFDGQFGVIRVFHPQEQAYLPSQESLFSGVREKSVVYTANQNMRFSLSEFRTLYAQQAAQKAQTPVEKKNNGLNAEQQAAVSHYRGPALCTAGPGSGKTRVLTERIKELIRTKHVNPVSILALTFTNKAAQEMRKRLAGIEQAAAVQIHTFHSLGLRLLKELLPELQNHYDLIDSLERERILQRYLSVEKGDVKRIARQIETSKQNVQTAADIGDAAFKELFERYEEFLNTQNLLELDDLIYRLVLLLERDTETASRLRTRFQWIMVDEYQDVNFAQYRLLQLLAGNNHPNLFVVGDPNQAIYGFRGADVTFIRRFPEDFPRAAHYRLKKSYRCSNHILKASEDILRAPSQARQNWLSGLSSGVKIELVREASDKSEAEWVARKIEEMLGGTHFYSMDSGVSSGKKSVLRALSEAAVLCRSSAQMAVLEEALTNHRIPYQRIDGQTSLRSGKVLHALELMLLAYHPENRYLQQKLIDLGIIASIAPQVPIPDRPVAQQMERLLKQYPVIKLSKKERERLLAAAEPFGSDTQAFLDFALLSTPTDIQRYNVEQVSLLTMHAAKGLEFEAVFVTGLEQGLLPYNLYPGRTSDEAEEQRLLYVAMTRAKKYLFLSSAKQRFLQGRQWNLERSVFLDRIEQELIENSVRSTKHKSKKNDGQLSLF